MQVRNKRTVTSSGSEKSPILCSSLSSASNLEISHCVRNDDLFKVGFLERTYGGPQ